MLDFDIGRHAFVFHAPAVFARPERQVRRRDGAAIHQHGKAEDAHQAAPRRLADQRAHVVFAEHPRQQVAARAGRLVDQHGARPLDRGGRRLHVGAIAHGPPGDFLLLQNLDVVIGHAAAAIETLVDDDGLLVRLREEIALEVSVAQARRIGHVHIRHLAIGGRIDLAHIAFDPIAVAQGIFGRHGHHGNRARALAVGRWPHGQVDGLAGRVLEGAVDIRRRQQRTTVDGQQVFARLDVQARLRQRRAQGRIPVQAAIHLLEAVMAVAHFVIGAQQAARHFLRLDKIVAAAAAMVAHSQFAAHPLNQAVQVCAAGQLGQEHGVLVTHGLPVHAMHARIIEIVAVDAPHFIENLRPLGARIGFHFDGVDLDLALPRRQQLARGGAHGPVVLLPVQQLLAIGRHFEIIGFGHHGFRLALFQIEALHGLLAIAFAQQEDLPRSASRQAGELRGRQRQVDDARGDAVEIDADRRHRRHHHFRIVAARLRIDLRFALRLGFRLRRVFFDVGAGSLFLVAFLDQRRRQVAPQHGHPYGARHQVVFILLREPVVAGACVGRREEVQVFAALVEHGLGHVGQAIGHRHRLVLLDGINVGAARVGGRIERVGQPARIGCPRGAHALVDAIHRLRGDILHLARADVDHIHAPAIVGKRDLLAVGRPDGVVIEAAAIQLELAYGTLAVLRAHMQFIFSRLVREIRDRAAIGRPDGRALVRASRARQPSASGCARRPCRRGW